MTKWHTILFLQKPEVLAQQRSQLTELSTRYLPDARMHYAGSLDDVPKEILFDLVISPPLDWLPEVLALIHRPVRLHLTSSGRDRLDALAPDLTGITVTTSAGVNASAIAEYVIGGILMQAKQFHIFRDRQNRAEWERAWLTELTERLIGIVGLGHIGIETARRANAFGMEIRGCVRTPREIPGVTRVYGMDQVGELAAWVDYLVLCVPLTPQTHGLIDADVLSRMRDGSLLINVSRGAVVDEQALIAALHNGRLAGAVLDVFDQEPLPADHPFWAMEQVVLTPHVAGTTQHYMENMFAGLSRE